MKSSKLLIVLSLVVMASMLLSACAQPTAAPTEAPVVATEAPAAPAFEGMSLAAPDCEYGGLIKEIAAVDEFTVRFTCARPIPPSSQSCIFTLWDSTQGMDRISYGIQANS